MSGWQPPRARHVHFQAAALFERGADRPDVSQGVDIALGRIEEVHSEVSGPVECATQHFIARSRNFVALSRFRRNFIAHFIAAFFPLAISPIACGRRRRSRKPRDG